MIEWLIKLLSGGVGAAVGQSVANVSAIVALAPVAYWFLGHKEEVAVALTWGQLGLFGLLVFAIIKIVHYTPPRNGA